jgi:hypothetical protein
MFVNQATPEDWQSLHNYLRDGLQKEVHVTRELLSNLRQEEVSLMLHDMGSVNQIQQIRLQMLERLSTLRSSRLLTTRKIEKIASIENPEPTLEQILPPNEEISSEILSLTDQLMALTERLHLQNTQNQRMAQHGEHHRYAPTRDTAAERPKRKASVATIQVKK